MEPISVSGWLARARALPMPEFPLDPSGVAVARWELSVARRFTTSLTEAVALLEAAHAPEPDEPLVAAVDGAPVPEITPEAAETADEEPEYHDPRPQHVIDELITETRERLADYTAEMVAKVEEGRRYA